MVSINPVEFYLVGIMVVSGAIAFFLLHEAKKQ